MASSPSAIGIIFIVFTFFFYKDAVFAKYTWMFFLKEMLINMSES